MSKVKSKIKRSSSPLRVHPQPTPKIGKAERTAPTGVSRSAFYQYFNDLQEVIETLLEMWREEIFTAIEPWFTGVGDPIPLLREMLAGLIDVCHERGPFLRAVTDAASSHPRLEKAWVQFLASFENAVTARIEADQEQGLIPGFDARPVAFAFICLDVYTILQAFGRRPRRRTEPVRKALTRIWISTLYGAEWLEKESSTLVRT